MRKIETLFLRAHETTEKISNTSKEGQLVVPTVRPGCEWVLAGEGIATEKFDGSACAVIDGKLYKRLHRHPLSDSDPLDGWIHWTLTPAQLSGHGWVPVGDGPDDRWHREAWDPIKGEFQSDAVFAPDGTFELVGPKVQGNPYGLIEHQLWRHGGKRVDLRPLNELHHPHPTTPYGARTVWAYLKAVLEGWEAEGIVFHHPDGRMAKIKRRDFGLPWPIRERRHKVSDAKLDAMLEGSEPS